MIGMLGRHAVPRQHGSSTSRRYASAAEVAAALGVSVATVRRWCATGVLPCRRLGRTVRIPIEAVDAPHEPSHD